MARSFNGTSQYLDYTSTGAAVSDYVTNALGTVAAWLKPYPQTAAGAGYDLPAVWGDTGGYIGLHRNTLNWAAYNWGGSEQTITAPLRHWQWQHVVWQHAGGVLYLWVDGRLLASTSSGNTSDTSNTTRVGRNYSSAYFAGEIGELAIWSAALTADQIKSIYAGKPAWRVAPSLMTAYLLMNGPAASETDFLATTKRVFAAYNSPPLAVGNSLLGGKPGRVLQARKPVAAGGGTYTGTSALSIKGMACAASAEFDAPVYTGAGTASVAPQAAAASATFAPGTRTASAAVSNAPQTAAASATFDPGTHTGSAAISAAPQVVAGTAEFDVPVYTGSGACSVGPIVCAASGTFAPPVYTGVGAGTIGPLVCAASGTFDAPVYTGAGAASVGPMVCAGSATFSASGSAFIATAAISIAPQTADGDATFAPGTHTGSVTITISPLTAAAAALFTPPVYSGNGAATIGPQSVTASALFTPPVYTGSATLSIVPQTVAGSAEFDAPVYDGTAAVSISPMACAGSGMYWDYGATAALVIAAMTAAGDVTFFVTDYPTDRWTQEFTVVRGTNTVTVTERLPTQEFTVIRTPNQ